MNPDRLPDALYTSAQTGELDRIAIEEASIPGLTLMRRAAGACLDTIECQWPRARSVSVFCGAGNNAGDGYILAGMLAERGRQVRVIVVGDPEKLGDDATAAWEYCRSSGASTETFEESGQNGTNIDPDCELVVDALLGTGLKGEVRPRFQAAIGIINQVSCPVLAVDIPSGLCADSGSELGVAVRATATVSFIGLKRGLLTDQGPELTGELIFASLDVPESVYRRVEADTLKLARERSVPVLPRRPRNSHKRHFGHVLVIGGDAGMGGAVAMAGEAALRTGAGLVSIATHPLHAASMISRRPELMTRGVESADDLEPLLERATTVVLGPGLGTSDWSLSLFERVMRETHPMVVDADGLNLLSENRICRDNWVLTPHPGEASRLVASAGDRFSDVRQLQEAYGGVVLLKGCGTLIYGGTDRASGKTMLCPYGNPGMASAGMGDILSGVIGGLLAQGQGLMESATLGAVVHARAADALVECDGERGMAATDLIPVIRQILNGRQ